MSDKLTRRGSGQRGDAYRHRGSAHARGYTATYVKAREIKLGRHPLCQVCEAQGMVTEAQETHHVVPVQADRSMAERADNLLSVCHRHHDDVEGMDWRELEVRYGIKQHIGFV